jgi:hypothetical protein
MTKSASAHEIAPPRSPLIKFQTFVSSETDQSMENADHCSNAPYREREVESRSPKMGCSAFKIP